jgi:hypothetical protein
MEYNDNEKLSFFFFFWINKLGIVPNIFLNVLELYLKYLERKILRIPI